LTFFERARLAAFCGALRSTTQALVLHSLRAMPRGMILSATPAARAPCSSANCSLGSCAMTVTVSKRGLSPPAPGRPLLLPPRPPRAPPPLLPPTGCRTCATVVP
jgi:hypothetical protein